MNPPVVVVFGPGYDDYRTELDVLAPYGVEHIEPVGLDDAARDARLATADAILVREAPLPDERIALLDRCRVIVRYGVGLDNIDLEAARRRRIYVANVPDYGSEEVAEHTLALILAVDRRVAQRDRDVRSGAWGIGARQPIRRLAGSTLGLVGFGRIAEAVWRKSSGIGFRDTLVVDPVRASYPKGVHPVDLDTLLRRSDVVSLHAPLTASTRHMLAGPQFDTMRDDAILVNTARGGLVDQAALVDTLTRGGLHGAGLDVFEEEPLPEDDPLRTLENVVLTDHTAWYSEASLDELQRGAAHEVARVLAGESPVNWVNRWTR